MNVSPAVLTLCRQVRDPGVLRRQRLLRAAGDAVSLAIAAGIVPDLWQADLLRSTAKQMILLCSRQSGKSTVTSLLALHEALYRPPALVLLLSPSLRQSQELFRKVRDAYGQLGREAPPISQESALRVEFVNGSRVLCLPASEATVRGYSAVRLLVVDEAAQVSDELYQVVRPMLAVSRGRIVLLSTPFGKRGFFWQVWQNGGADWERVQVRASECPRIDPTWLANERAAIDPWWYRQEYECEFLDPVDNVFPAGDVAALLADPSVQALDI